MNKLSQLKEFESKLNNNIDVFDNLISEYIIKIKEEYKTNVNKIVKDICEGEGLNYEDIKTKYLLKSQKKDDIVNQEILDKIEINNKDFYYEKKQNGNVYDNNLNIVGKYYDNKIIFN